MISILNMEFHNKQKMQSLCIIDKDVHQHKYVDLSSKFLSNVSILHFEVRGYIYIYAHMILSRIACRVLMLKAKKEKKKSNLHYKSAPVPYVSLDHRIFDNMLQRKSCLQSRIVDSFWLIYFTHKHTLLFLLLVVLSRIIAKQKH